MQVGSLTSKILPNEILHYNYHLPHTLALINSMLNHYVQACEDPYNSKIWCPPHQNCITTSPLTLLSLFHQLLLHPITFFCNAYNKEESLGEFSGRSLEMHVYFLKDFTSVGLHSSLSFSLFVLLQARCLKGVTMCHDGREKGYIIYFHHSCTICDFHSDPFLQLLMKFEFLFSCTNCFSYFFVFSACLLPGVSTAQFQIGGTTSLYSTSTSKCHSIFSKRAYSPTTTTTITTSKGIEY